MLIYCGVLDSEGCAPGYKLKLFLKKAKNTLNEMAVNKTHQVHLQFIPRASHTLSTM
jgi:hypothetical protein